MMGLSDSERMLMMHSAVLTQSTCVTDGRTDRRTDGIGMAHTRYSMLSRVIKLNWAQCDSERIHGGAKIRNVEVCFLYCPVGPRVHDYSRHLLLDSLT